MSQDFINTRPTPRRNRYMDFIPPSSSRSVKPRPVRPAQTRSSAQPRVIEEYRETTTIFYPNHAQPASKAPAPKAPAHTTAQLVSHPASRPAPRAVSRPTPQSASRPTLRSTTSAPEPVSVAKPQPTPSQMPATEPLGVIENVNQTQDDLDAPDGNRFALGGKSPFLVSAAEVDKRPLSGHLPDHITSGVHSTKNIYSRRDTAKGKKSTVAPIIVDAKIKDRSGLKLTIAIFVTLILGALVGAFVYLAFFQ